MTPNLWKIPKGRDGPHDGAETLIAYIQLYLHVQTWNRSLGIGGVVNASAQPPIVIIITSRSTIVRSLFVDSTCKCGRIHVRAKGLCRCGTLSSFVLRVRDV
jgi:hypothetical protein